MSDRSEADLLFAVYDLGGGTFDATLVNVGAGGARVLGHPEGIERLGGIDFDSAVFDHVRTHAPELFAELDDNELLVSAALAQIREGCRRAKEALSADTDAAVVVALPAGMARVWLSRGEFEERVRPQLMQSVDALRRALHSASVEPAALDRILLVGGSSRIPAVAHLLAGELGRPVAVDSSPKDAIALGAAVVAHTSTSRSGVVDQWPHDRDDSPSPAPAPAPEPEPERDAGLQSDMASTAESSGREGIAAVEPAPATGTDAPPAVRGKSGRDYEWVPVSRRWR